jgi:hypothetical protein
VVSNRRAELKIGVAALVLCLVIGLAGCTSAGESGSPVSTTAASTTSSLAATSTSSTPAAAYASEPALPLGPLPSFNESPGCGEPQGIRGPYATDAGDLSDSEAVLGPWGDIYGRDIAEVRSRLVEVALPMTGDPEVTVWVHQAVLPALNAALANLEREEAAGNYYQIRQGDVSSFRPSTVTPKRYLSFHAVGAAIDINASTNPYRADNVLTTDMPDWFVKAWTDAGWCWGGDWQEIKDPMHFSWEGSLYTSGYVLTAPVPPRTEAAVFSRRVTFSTVLGPAPEGSNLLLADMDRDGAPDAVRLHPWAAAGGLGIEIAQALYDFRAGCTPLVTAPVAAGAVLLLADGDGDGRPDVWEVDSSTGRVAVTIHTFASGYSQRLRPRGTGIAAGAAAVFLAADYDRDGSSDLFVIDGDVLEVWAGPGFGTRLARAALPPEVGAGWRFALGDRDVDGVPDLFALGPGTPARLLILPGAAGFSAHPEAITGEWDPAGAFQVGDLDGDGRPDLYFLDTDGSLAVYLGGERGDASDTDLTYWFVEADDQPTTYQEGCPVLPTAP